MRKIEVEILDNDSDNCLVSINVNDVDIVTKGEIDVSNYLVIALKEKLKNMGNNDKKILPELTNIRNMGIKNTTENVEKTLILRGKNRKGIGE